jgi:hypothetical protein
MKSDQTSMVTRLILLWVLFVIISFFLGYPTLNRYKPELTAALPDTYYYVNLVKLGITDVIDSHWRYRVLIPYIARPIYFIAQGRVGSWDPAFFALLVTNSIFIASSAICLGIIFFKITKNWHFGIFGALLFLLHFNVSNLYLSGLIDSGELFFMIALILALMERRWWILPFLGIFGSLARETFIPFSGAFAAGWYISQIREDGIKVAPVLAIALMGVLGLIMFTTIRFLFDAETIFPWQFAKSISTIRPGIFSQLIEAFFNRGFAYGFIWLLPLGLLGIKEVPKNWLFASLAATVLAITLTIIAGSGQNMDNINRPLFSTIGPLLLFGSTAFLWNLFELNQSDKK